MPATKWHHVRSKPFTAIRTILIATCRSIIAIGNKIVNPSHPLSFRTAIVRVWVATSFGADHMIWYSEPERHNIHKFATSSTESAYIITTTNSSNVEKEIQNADVVYLYAHGGGLFIGHPLQYLDEYRRWVKRAESLGKKMVIITPHYPLSPQKKWPAQLHSFLAGYDFILEIAPSARVIFGGDSGGANLVLLALLHLRDHCSLSSIKPVPLPRAAVTHSPSIDLTSAETQFTPRIAYDYIFTYPQIAPFMNDALRPEGLPFDSPEISALLHPDVAGLPPQLVYWSSTEILATDAERWVKRCKEAGNQILEFRREGMLHTFSLGSPFVGREIRDECDEVLMGFLFSLQYRRED